MTEPMHPADIIVVQDKGRWLAYRAGEYKMGPHGWGDDKKAALAALKRELANLRRQTNG